MRGGTVLLQSTERKHGGRAWGVLREGLTLSFGRRLRIGPGSSPSLCCSSLLASLSQDQRPVSCSSSSTCEFWALVETEDNLQLRSGISGRQEGREKPSQGLPARCWWASGTRGAPFREEEDTGLRSWETVWTAWDLRGWMLSADDFAEAAGARGLEEAWRSRRLEANLTQSLARSWC